MEPEVHFVGGGYSYPSATLTNIMARGRKEIDILAVESLGKDRIHIEVRCVTTFHLRARQTHSPKADPIKMG